MYALQLLSLALALPLAQAQETVLGLYIFAREGDRTAELTPPTILTELGYREVFDAGSWFRQQYVGSGGSKRIWNLQSDKPDLAQLMVSAPLDNVMSSSATGFMQGIYPPVGEDAAQANLRNGSQVNVPLQGYQIVPVQSTASGVTSSGSGWMQGSSNCNNAIISSNRYYNSTDYYNQLNNTRSFYNSLSPVINGTLNPNDINYFDAYNIYDLINVANIHNSSVPGSNLINDNTLFQLRTLADNHEFNLAYNSSDPIRAIAGASLAGQVVQTLNNTINSQGRNNLLNVQFGDYLSFQSFFGLAQLNTLPGNGTNFVGIPDYASTLSFELFTTANPEPFPSTQDLQVRFYFHNGTATDSDSPIQYPLFADTSIDMSWSDFTDGMGKFSVSDQGSWCNLCGNSTGVCTPVPAPPRKQAVSPGVGGVIGAIVALLLIVVALIVLCFLGCRCHRRPKVAKGMNGHGDGGVVKA